MKDAIAFKLGDKVYCPFHGYGVVSAIYDDNRTYPVQVTWDGGEYKKKGEIDSFTANGFTIIGLESDTGKLIVVQSAPPKEDEKEGKFKVGDRVYFPYFGLGTVTTVCDRGGYPVEVTWNNGHVTSFTPEGFLGYGDNDKLTVIKFKVGDMVRSRGFGVGVVDEVLDSEYPYPITVKWTDGSLGYGTYSSFTLEGHYYPQRSDAEKDITLL